MRHQNYLGDLLVRVICPDCSERGSLQMSEYEGIEGDKHKYWRVHHSDKKRCYLGRGPIDVHVIRDEKPPVGTQKFTVDDTTNPQDI